MCICMCRLNIAVRCKHTVKILYYKMCDFVSIQSSSLQRYQQSRFLQYAVPTVLGTLAQIHLASVLMSVRTGHG